MRNLKRALSLAMASVMLLGMMVVGTGASYADVDSKDNVEAIEVMQAVGVMVGDTNGNFNPDQKVTRGEMAVVMANLLNLKVEDFVGAKTPFTDVPEWATAYVAACYADGITAGISATQYGFNYEVTTAQAALMMMKALGYFQNAKDFGSDWQVATVKQGSKINLFDGVEAGASTAMTRNDVAQIALNTLEATMVETDGTSTDITLPGDISISTGDTKYVEVEKSGKAYTAISGTYDEGDTSKKYTVQLGEELFDGDLTKASNQPDNFGRPGDKWSYDGDEIGVYSSTADATYVGAVEVGTIYDDLGLDAKINTSAIKVYEDSKSGAAGDFALVEDGEDEYGKAGQTVEVYYDSDADTTKVKICIVSSYLGVVADDDYTKDGKDGALIDVFGQGDLFYEGTGFKNDDVLLLNVADGKIQAILGAPTTVTGSVTRKGTDGALTIDGTKYDKAAQFDAAGDGDVIEGTDSISLGSDYSYTLYLDQNGAYLAAVVNEESTQTDLVYVFDTATGTTLNGNKLEYGVYATVVYMDGTTEELLVSETASTEAGIPDKSTILGYKGDIMTLSYDEDDDAYSLKTDLGDYTSGNVNASVEIKDDSKSAKLDGSKNYYLNSKTTYVFISKDDEGKIDDIQVKTGAIEYTTIAGDFLYDDSNRVAYMVFEEAFESSAKDVIYITDKTAVGDVEDGKLYKGYYVGETEEKELPVDKDSTSVITDAGLYEYSVKSNGNLKVTALTEGKLVNKTVISITDGMIDVGEDQPYDASNAAVVDLKDGDHAYGKAISSLSTLKRVVDNDNYGAVTVTMYVNGDDEVEGIFITNVAEKYVPSSDSTLKSASAEQTKGDSGLTAECSIADKKITVTVTGTAEDQDEITVTVVKNDEKATVSNSGTVTLTYETDSWTINPEKVTVTAEDKSTTEYTVEVVPGV